MPTEDKKSGASESRGENARELPTTPNDAVDESAPLDDVVALQSENREKDAPIARQPSHPLPNPEIDDDAARAYGGVARLGSAGMIRKPGESEPRKPGASLPRKTLRGAFAIPGRPITRNAAIRAIFFMSYFLQSVNPGPLSVRRTEIVLASLRKSTASTHADRATDWIEC